MTAKDLARRYRDHTLPLERLRHRHRSAALAGKVLFAGDWQSVSLGEDVFVQGPTSLFVTNGGGLYAASLVVGARTYIGEYNNIRCAGAPIHIGADCLISQQISIVGSNHGIEAGRLIVDQPWEGSGVVIGNGVWVGAGAKILSGSRIGDGAVIAANAVVRGVVAAGDVVGGVPARVLAQRVTPGVG